jgi:hypothetical protein
MAIDRLDDLDWLDLASQQAFDGIDAQLINELKWQVTQARSPEYHVIELGWERGRDSMLYWDQAVDWVYEQFGAPGPNGRYITHATEMSMRFLFKHEQDAILMALKWV